ncbi:DRAM2 protein, partial [Pitta sordida]|nr:DRAM2 protein [Pitta sordida]
MWWFQQGMSAFPAFLVVWTAASFLIPYVLAVLLRHVDPVVPYISDTGNVPPERCLFGIMLNISTFLGVATVYIRYKQVSSLNPDKSRILGINRLGLALGWMSCFGLCLITNFQKCVLYSVHVLGAALTFGVGFLYLLLQTLLSFLTQPELHGNSVLWARLAVSLWSCSSIATMFVSSVLLARDPQGPSLAQKLHWHPQDRGYTLHMISTVSEWSLAFSFLSFFLTYIRDFQEISLRAVVTLRGQRGLGAEEQQLLLPGSL